jgi:hypothetical protein
LERCTSRGGKDSIDHPSGAHDDIANAVAGALVVASKVNADDEMSFAIPQIVYANGGSSPTPNPRIPPHWLKENQYEPWQAYTLGGGFWAGLPAASRYDRKPW